MEGEVTLTFGAHMFGSSVKCLTEHRKADLDKSNSGY